jgi:hypothetical protein
MYQFPPEIIGVKYRIKKINRECNYGLIISCLMSADIWRRNVFNLAEFGDRLQLMLPHTSTFTF